MPIESTHSVDDVMRQWPATIRVFLKYKMRCVGCPIACFHTVEDACREHGAGQNGFLADLRAAAVQDLAFDTTDEPPPVAARWP